MNVLMISGDKNLLTPGGEAEKRLALQRSAVGRLDVFVWPSVHTTRQIYRAARKNRYDVITAQDPFWRGLFAWKIARFTGAKLNVQVHADLSGQSFLKHVLAQIVLRHADSVRVVSEKIRDQVVSAGVKVPVHVLPVYVDLERFRGLTHTPQENKKTILWIGRFEEEKNPEEMLPLFQKVRDAGIDASLVLLGAGSLGLRLKTAHNLNYKDTPVDFPGWADPAHYLAKADVVVSTSKHESWGASMIEALAAGVPVVATDVGVAKEAGAIVVPREKLADAVIEVLRSGIRGELKLPVLSAGEWVQKWRASLI